MRSRLRPPFGALLLAVAGCASSGPVEVERPREATSLLGRPLYPMDLAPQVGEERVAQLRAARAAHVADPGDEALIIWYGRRAAYLGDYRRAIDIYSEGLARLPESYKLLRHRGHRFITTRRLDEAIDDLTRAADLIRGVPDEVEPDGVPNRLNIPTSTSHGNVHYHLGLAHYLVADYEAALVSYRASMGFAANDDMRAATSYWLYITLRRLDRPAEAAAAIEWVSPETEVIENTAYLQLLRLFREALAVEDVTGRDSMAEIDDATLAYGIAMWRLLDGDEAGAQAAFDRILACPAWPAFGYIAAEAEVARRGKQ